MPSESFDGILAGGLYVQQTGSEEFQGNVQNLLAREVAVLLVTKRPTSTSGSVEEAHLEEINRRNVIIVAVENTAANYLSKATLAYEVFHDGQATAIKGEKEIQLAPNALMNYAPPLDGNELQSGEYEIKRPSKQLINNGKRADLPLQGKKRKKETSKMSVLKKPLRRSFSIY